MSLGHQFAFLHSIGVGVHDHRVVPAQAQLLLHAADQRRVEGVRQVREGDADELRPQRLQPAGEGVGAVPQLGDNLLDPQSRRLSDRPGSR